MHMRNITILLGAALALAGCASNASTLDPASTDAPAPPTPMLVVARDYALTAPTSVQEGTYTVTLENRGTELHHVGFYRLAPGHTADELRASLEASRGGAPSWAIAYGGPNVATPPAPTSATFRLDPGEYALVCIIPSPDHVMHLAKGMMTTMTVTEIARDALAQDDDVVAPVPLPDADARITLRSFAFDLDRPLHGGTNEIRVVNDGPDIHEVVVFELMGGASTQDLIDAIEAGQGPPPARPVGGTTPLSPGREVHLSLDLTPGRYTLICFDTDGAPHGEMHVALGMMHEFTISAPEGDR